MYIKGFSYPALRSRSQMLLCDVMVLFLYLENLSNFEINSNMFTLMGQHESRRFQLPHIKVTITCGGQMSHTVCASATFSCFPNI